VEAGYNLHRWRGEFRWKDAEVITLMLSIIMTWSTTPPYDVPPHTNKAGYEKPNNFWDRYVSGGFSRLTELGKKKWDLGTYERGDEPKEYSDEHNPKPMVTVDHKC